MAPRYRRFPLLLFTAGSAAACASAAGPSQASKWQMMSVAGNREVDPRALEEEILFVDTVAAPAQKAWTELIRSYAELRIPVTNADETRLIIGGSAVGLGQLGGKRPSAWLDCGRGTGVGEYADLNEVTFSMATAVLPIDSLSSTIQSLVRATAKARDVSTEAVRCRSLGTLEIQLGDRVRSRIGPSSR